MYIVLKNEIADVDLTEFEKVGSFRDGVAAVPLIDVSLGLKGMRTSPVDRVDDCQNSIILSYDAPEDEEQLEVELLEDPFIPGILYRARRTTRDYVELLYKAPLSALTVYVYFLVGIEDCAFAYGPTRIDYVDLWKMELIRDFSD